MNKQAYQIGLRKAATTLSKYVNSMLSAVGGQRLAKENGKGFDLVRTLQEYMPYQDRKEIMKNLYKKNKLGYFWDSQASKPYFNRYDISRCGLCSPSTVGRRIAKGQPVCDMDEQMYNFYKNDSYIPQADWRVKGLDGLGIFTKGSPAEISIRRFRTKPTYQQIMQQRAEKQYDEARNALINKL